jgi:Tfp pilus assembly protein PilV
MKSEKGSSLIEVLVALALLGAIGIAFLGALATTSSSRAISNEHNAGRILAASQMESILNEVYSMSYHPVQVPSEYNGYTTAIDIDNLFDGNIQKITITVRHHDKYITKLESYKVIR